MKKVVALLLVLVAAFGGGCVSENNDADAEIKKFYEQTRFIAHALGEIDDVTYTNSLEAFNFNYGKGHRVFEVDLTLTADNVLVGAHDDPAVTLDEFMQQKIHGKYTPLSIYDLNDLMSQYDDIYLVTDTKFTDEKRIGIQFGQIAEVIPPANLERIIPQVYSFEMYDQIQKIHEYKNIILTLYQQMMDTSDTDIIKGLSSRPAIRALTMPESRTTADFNESLSQIEIPTYVHTINDMAKWEELQLKGVHGVYTDTLVG